MRREVLSAAWPVMVSYVAVGLPCGVLAAKAGMGPLQNFCVPSSRFEPAASLFSEPLRHDS